MLTTTTKKSFLALTALLAIVLASCSTPQQGTMTKVRIAYLPNVHGLPLYLALEKGYFTDEGLDVDLVKFEAPNQAIDALLSNQVDVGGGVASGIIAVSESKKPNSIKIISLQGGTEEFRNEALVVKTDSAINSFADLKGKKLGHLPGIQWQTVAKLLLARNGLIAGKDTTLVDLAFSTQVPALASGQIDALLAIEPSPTIAEGKGIGKVIVKSPTLQYIASPFYGGAAAITTKLIAEQPEVAAKILHVFKKATDEVAANPNAARPYLKNYTPLDDELIKKVPLLLYKTYDELEEKDIAALQAFYDMFAEYEIINEKIDARSLIYAPSR